MKKILKKTILVLFLVSTLILLFNADKKPDKNTKGKIAIWLGYPETQSAYEAAKKKFNEKYPNIEVNILTFTLREFESKLSSSMPTDVGPDILVLHDFIFERYYSNDYLEVLPSDQAAIISDPKKMDPIFRSIVERDGKIYAIPYWTGKRCLFYNKDYFKEAGLTKPPATIEELWKYAEKLTKKDAAGNIIRAGITLRLTGATGVFQKLTDFYYQETGVQILEQGKKPGTIHVTIKDNLDVAAKVLMDHINHLHGDKKVDDWALNHDTAAFSEGIAAMLMRETWGIRFVETNNPKLNFDTAPVPRSKFNGAFNYVETLAVNKDSKLKEACWEFLRILQEQEMVNVLLKDAGYTPLRKDRDYSSFLKKNPRYKSILEQPHKNYVNYLEPANLAYEEVTTRCGEIEQKAFLDKSLVNNLNGCKEVMLKVQEKAEQILKEQDILSD